MAALPHVAADILLPRTHRTGYAHALAASGARLVDIGHNDRGTGAGVRGLEAWEIEAVLSPSVVAVGFSVNATSIVDLPTAAAVCRAHGVPLIVDAAAQLPPKENLCRFIAMGADLVAFSGGKALGGPQASGILAGRRDLIASALLQQLDMDVAPDTWSPPKLIDRANLRGVPHHGIGRGFKAGKEEIVGLLTALDRFVKADDAAANAVLETRLRAIAVALNGHAVTLVPAATTGRVPVLEIAVPDALEVSARLQRGDPPVHLSERHAGARGADPRSPGAVAGARRAAGGGAQGRALRGGKRLRYQWLVKNRESFVFNRLCRGVCFPRGKNCLKSKRASIIRFPREWETVGSFPSVNRLRRPRRDRPSTCRAAG